MEYGYGEDEMDCAIKRNPHLLNLACVGYLKLFYFANYFYKEKPLGF
jgi:hypothetical protein